ncbi:MAG: hypothetical protein ACHQF2_06240 [Flavobacteriales bacterium]
MWILIVLAFTACLPKNQKSGGNNDPGGKWPEEWNADMEVSVGYGGGMTPEWWDMTVKGDSATYKHSYSQNEIVIKVKLSKEELDSIARVIRKNEPHKIKMKEHGIIYDKGTTFLKIRHKQRILTVAESANESFTKDGWKDFNKMYSMVSRIVERNTRKTKINVTVNVECKGSKGYWCQIQHNDRFIKVFGCVDTARTAEINIYPGRHAFYAYIFKSEDGLYKYPQKNWPFNNVDLRIMKDTVINFQLKDSILELRK